MATQRKVKTIRGDSGRLTFGRPVDRDPNADEREWKAQLDREGYPKLTYRGAGGAFLWRGKEAATVASWSVVAQQGGYRLTALLNRIDAFQIRQRPLLFAAPRVKPTPGFWAWGVDRVESFQGNQLVAVVGPPENN